MWWRCCLNLQKVAESAAEEGLSTLFRNELAAWDQEAGTTFVQDHEHARTEWVHWDSWDYYPHARCSHWCDCHGRVLVLSVWPGPDARTADYLHEERVTRQRLKRAQMQELRSKQQAKRYQLKGKDMRLSHPRLWRAQGVSAAQFNR